MLTAGLIQRDAAGRLVTAASGALLFNGGTPVDAAGALRVSTSAVATGGVPAPVKDYDLIGPVLPSDITFTRATEGTYFDSLGVMRTALANVPRFDYHPVTHEALGLLIEGPRTNAVLSYVDYANPAFWAPFQCAVTPNATQAPDGTNTGSLVVPTAGVTGLLSSIGPLAVTAGTAYVVSQFFKAQPGSPYNEVTLFVADGARFATFNLITKAIANTPGVTPSIQDVGNGWLRCSVSFAPSVSGNADIHWARVDSGGGFDGIHGFYAWGAQAEVGGAPTSLIKSAGAATSRVADLARFLGANFSAFWNPAQGTLQVTAASTDGTPANYPRILAARDAADANRLDFSTTAEFPTASFLLLLSNVVVVNAPLIAMPQRVFVNFAGTYKVNEYTATANGGAVQVFTPAGLLVADRIELGSTGGAYFINGWIKRFKYWAAALTAAQLQAATSIGGSYVAGLFYGTAGALLVADGGAIAGYAPGGMPVTAGDALCVAYGGVPAYFVAGIPFDAAGRVCVVAPVLLSAFSDAFDEEAFA